MVSDHVSVTAIFIIKKLAYILHALGQTRCRALWHWRI